MDVRVVLWHDVVDLLAYEILLLVPEEGREEWIDGQYDSEVLLLSGDCE